MNSAPSTKGAAIRNSSGSAALTLWIDPRRQALLINNGVTCLRDLDAANRAAQFDKPTLPDWRRRFAIELSGDDGDTHRLFVKRFLSPPFAAQLKRILSGHARRGAAGVEKYWIDRVGSAGIPVPLPAAIAEDVRAIWERDSALVLAEAPGESLESWARRGQRASRVWGRELARFVARLHAAGFIHRDLYLCHIFVNGPEDRRPDFCLIDLQRVLHAPIRRKRWIVRELAQLQYSTPASAATRSDRMRWLKAYLGGEWFNRRKRRAMIRRVVRKAQSIAAHDARRRNQNRGSQNQGATA